MRRRAPGVGAPGAFTLVEMLVVLVVLSIAAALAVVALRPDPRGVLEREATRLAGALEQASATAQFRGETLGVSAQGRLYRFWRRDGDGQWQVITGDDVLGPRALPDAIAVKVRVYAGAAIAADAIIPFRPSGRNEPFRIDLVAPAWQAEVVADPLNRVSFRLAAAPAS